jgi:hypothetical protein
MGKTIVAGAAIFAAVITGCSTDSHRFDVYRDGAANIAPQIAPMPTAAPSLTTSHTPTPVQADPWQAWGIAALSVTFGGLGWVAWANARRAAGEYSR